MDRLQVLTPAQAEIWKVTVTRDFGFRWNDGRSLDGVQRALYFCAIPTVKSDRSQARCICCRKDSIWLIWPRSSEDNLVTDCRKTQPFSMCSLIVYLMRRSITKDGATPYECDHEPDAGRSLRF
jgi:hypothetical protein